MQIANIGNKTVILDSEHNQNLIQSLKIKGKKHITQLNKIIVEANPKIYEIFNKQQLTEIISSLTSRSEIPYKFSYFDQGAILWDEYHRILSQKKDSFVNNDYQLLFENIDNTINRIKNYKKVNFIDIGCGNGLPVIPIIN